ncbi:Tubulin alpha-1C chain-like isoform X4 [Oopsacas minuta]|uniref:Tubulin alpha chain n=1 Tax=Oopsacas minuta TaxID=111878 RepID=A0AAV7JCQ8_9METZ|nr:Tubulin alpha-1C chain-like isoform X4 [Oopsacas minuta]
MREIISIHVGQAGCQIGNACWELYALEHGISSNGTMSDNSAKADMDSVGTFFQDTKTGQWVPRSVFVDLEPSVIDQIRTGPYRKMYHPSQLISGKEDAANNFSRGYNTAGRVMVADTMDRIRKEAEQCEDRPQGYFIFHSLGGGTGAGFGSLLTRELQTQFGSKTSKFEFGIIPAPQVSTSVVEPYNAVLSMESSSIEHYNVSFLFDNEAIYKISKNNLEVERPAYSNLNRLICQNVSSITSSLRFPGQLNVDLSEFEVNLVPFPKIHYPLSSYSPIISKGRASKCQFSVKEITTECFEPSNHMIVCDPRMHKYLSCCLLYRGDVLPRDATKSIEHIRNQSNFRFVDWIPCSFKVGITPQVPSVPIDSEMAQTPRSACLLSNSTAISDTLVRLGSKFDMMFSKRAFVHWFIGEGMEEGEFIDARESLEIITRDYTELIGDNDQEF